MAAEASSATDARMKLTCSHGGHFLPCGPDGALRYVGGETRVLVVPRAVSFKDLVTRLSEMAGGAEVRLVRHRLADAGLEDVIVTVTCDEEVAHMFDEYDRLRATRPSAAFRVFVTTTIPPGSGGGDDVQRRRAARMRRVHSEQTISGSAQLHRRPAYPVAMRRVQSAQELRMQQSVHHRRHQSRCVCQRQCPRTAAPAPAPSRQGNEMCAPPYMSKNDRGVSDAEKAATARSRGAKSTMDFDKGRAIWEFE
ncbi:hypothetical protein EJB05_05107, partial [Eragrostis curvula]